jgi:hypothetical protein
MLPYALAIIVGLSSLVLFSTAFFMSDVHRQDDFFWSSIGLFYALVLWFCATRITGALLLGQAAAVALLMSYNWQTLKLRKAIANPERAAELNNFSVVTAVSNLFNRQPKTVSKPKVTPTQTAVIENKPATIPSPEITSETKNIVTSVEETTETVSQPPKKGLFNKFFDHNTEKAAITNTKLDEILDDEELIDEDVELATEEAKVVEAEIESIPITKTQETATPPSIEEATLEVTIEKIEVKLTPEALAEEGKIDEIFSLVDNPTNNEDAPTAPPQNSIDKPKINNTESIEKKTEKTSDTSKIDEFLAKLDEKPDTDPK